MKKSIKLEAVFIIILLITAFIVRLYKINNPIADWHSWRQADTSAVTRNFEKFGFNPLYPRFDDLSNIPSGKDNPLGYRFVEFPIYNSLSFILSKILVQFHFSIEIWQRLVSIFSSLGSIYLLYLISKKYLGRAAALFSAFFMAVLPYNIYYARTILPEPTLVALSLSAIYSFIKFQNSRSNNRVFYFMLFILLSSLSLLVKPTAVFLLLPVLYFFISKFTFSRKSILISAASLVIIFLPFILWRIWTANFPEGVPVWTWLLNGDGIRFKGAFFYWLFAERLAKLILGYWGIFFLLLGILSMKGKKESWFFNLWGISMLLYFIVIATGNVKHDYYQVITLPIITVYLGRGVEFLIYEAKKIFAAFTVYTLTVAVIIFSLAFSWYQIRTYYWINKPEIVEAGKMADQILPKNAKVIAPYGGDTAFLYQTNRQGWPIGFEIEEKIKQGAEYYVSFDINDWETSELVKKYELFYKSKNYAILKLQ